MSFIVIFLSRCSLYLLLEWAYTTLKAFWFYFKCPSSIFSLATPYSIWEHQNFSLNTSQTHFLTFLFWTLFSLSFSLTRWVFFLFLLSLIFLHRSSFLLSPIFSLENSINKPENSINKPKIFTSTQTHVNLKSILVIIFFFGWFLAIVPFWNAAITI